jgi:hypothetical protein
MKQSIKMVSGQTPASGTGTRRRVSPGQQNDVVTNSSARRLRNSTSGKGKQRAPLHTSIVLKIQIEDFVKTVAVETRDTLCDLVLVTDRT